MAPAPQFLLLLFLATTLVFTGLPERILSGSGQIAWADDDDDDGGDDDDDDGGSERSSGERSRSEQIRPERQRASSGTPWPFRLFQPRQQPPARQRAAAPAPVRLAEYAPELVVSGLTPGDLQVLIGEEFAVLETVELPGIASTVTRLSGPPGQELSAARDRVRALTSGQDADFNHYYRSEAAEVIPAAVPQPAACAHANCSAHAMIGWQEAAQRQALCAVVQPIGVIDTGVNTGHELLSGAQIELVTIGSRAGDPSKQIHGTAVVSVLAGQPGGRVEGLVPEAPLVVVDVFSRSGSDERADVVSLLRGLDEMDRRGIRLVNMSLAGPDNSVLSALVQRLVAERGMVLVAAAGNGGPKAEAAFPAGYDGVIAVTAVDGRGRIYRSAQRGSHLDIAAPGVGLMLATSIKGAREKTGTSFATPFVTGTIALMLTRDPDLTPAEVSGRLVQNVRDLGAEGHDEVFGHGMVMAEALCTPAP